MAVFLTFQCFSFPNLTIQYFLHHKFLTNRAHLCSKLVIGFWPNEVPFWLMQTNYKLFIHEKNLQTDLLY